eukprot:3914291-Amphidinium_carterae.2
MVCVISLQGIAKREFHKAGQQLWHRGQPPLTSAHNQMPLTVLVAAIPRTLQQEGTNQSHADGAKWQEQTVRNGKKVTKQTARKPCVS